MKMKGIVLSTTLLMILTLVSVAPPALAETLAFKVKPTTSEEREVLEVFRKFVSFYGGQANQMAMYLSEDVVYLSTSVGYGVQPEYRGKQIVASLLTSRGVSRVSINDIEIRVVGESAEVKAFHQYDLDLGHRTRSITSRTIWRLRREADGWKVHFIDPRG